MFCNEKVLIGISKKSDGMMKFVRDDLDEKVLRNRVKYFENFNIDYKKQVISAKQTHSNNVVKVGKSDFGKFIDNCDALITNQKGAVLSITVADCIPVYFYDFKKEVVGISHAGYLGLLSGIITNTIKSMNANFSSDASNIQVLVGPHIQKCHFEIKEDVLDKFEDYKRFIIYKNNKMFVDLKEIAHIQLSNLGIDEKNIKISNECTYCEDKKYFSYRKSNLDYVEAMIAYIGLK